MGTPEVRRGDLDAAWRWLPWLLPAVVALLAPLGTLDLAYQLRLGAQIVAERAIPTSDTFTFSVPGAPWVDQQWLGQVLLHAVDAAGGWSGLAVLGAVLIGLTAGLIGLACRGRGVDVRTAAVLALGSFVVAAPTLAVRPQLFGVAGVALGLWAVATRNARPWRPWLLPAVALVLANVHGSFPIVVIIAVLVAVEDRDRRAVLVALTTVAASVVTPSGPAVWAYVWDITSDPVIRTQVTEWAAPSLGTVAGVLGLLSVLAVAVVAWRRRARVRGIDVAWLIVFLVPAVASQRATVWWALAAPVVVAGWLAAEDRTDRVPGRGGVPIVVLLGVVAVLALPWWRGGPTLDDAPPGVAGAVAALPDGTRVMAYQPWSSWLEREALSAPVYVDARIELFPADVWGAYDRLLVDTPSVLDEVGAQAVAGPASWAPIGSVRTTTGWEVAYEGPDGVVLVREGLLGEGLLGEGQADEP